MPTITSQRTGPEARRDRRRARQRQKRLSINFAHRQLNHRRSIPKRQLRELSADVDDCFEDCQELGYHLEPDIHVGSLVAQGNPFSLLDPEYSSHSTPDPVPTPYQDHTIRPPNPFLAELEWHVAKKSYAKLEDIQRAVPLESEAKDEDVPPGSRFWWRSPRQVDDLEANRASVGKTPPPTAQATLPPSAQSCSIPTIPPSGTNVNLPGAFPLDSTSAPLPRPSKKRKLNDATPPTFLHDYRVPSPLLYHKQGRGALPNRDDEDNSCICLGPSFEHVKEKDEIIIDPVSKGSSWSQSMSNSAAETSQRPLQNQYRFVAAALPNMGIATPYSPLEQAVLTSDPEFYTNTRPYLSPRRSPVASKIVTGTSTPSVRPSIPPLAKAKKLTTHIFAAEDLRSTDTPLPSSGASSIPEQSGAPRPSRPIFRSQDLISPKLIASAGYRDKSLDRYFERTINFWSKHSDEKQQEKADHASLNNDTVGYVQDRRSKFQELWDTYEKAVLGPKRQVSASSKNIYVLSDLDRTKVPIIGVPGARKGSNLLPLPMSPVKPTPIDLKLPREMSHPVWLPNCTTLVPAKLHEQQYLGLTKRWNSDIWNLEQGPLPTSSTTIKQIQKIESQSKIRKAVDWLKEDLGLDKMFCEEQEDDGAYLPWLQGGWDGHLFYPETAALDVYLALPSPFEDIELGEEGYQGTNSEAGSGTQVDEATDEDLWWEWDDDARGWSEPSEDEFFDFEF